MTSKDLTSETFNETQLERPVHQHRITPTKMESFRLLISSDKPNPFLKR